MPSLIRGHNIIKSINEINSDLIFDIEETSQEILFKFNYKNANRIIPYLKPKTSGADRSPFSSKNLPKTKYIIPDEDLVIYKEIVSKIPKNELISIVHTTKKFIEVYAKKNLKGVDIKADMALKGLKGKDYIHSIGAWDKYIEYLKKNIKEN